MCTSRGLFSSLANTTENKIHKLQQTSNTKNTAHRSHAARLLPRSHSSSRQRILRASEGSIHARYSLFIENCSIINEGFHIPLQNYFHFGFGLVSSFLPSWTWPYSILPAILLVTEMRQVNTLKKRQLLVAMKTLSWGH